MSKADIGMIGLAVMGENLSLNMESKGFTVAVFNKETEWIDRFLKGRGKDKHFIGTYSLAELTDSLKKPRKIMMMIKAGKPVDEVIAGLLPLLEEGDIIIDGGNSHFQDTIRRTKLLEENKIRFIGTGVSGGEEGALTGPSIMPGGSREAWPFVKPILQAIAAKADDAPCCEWVGDNGAGHYVKMVHNGIEYGDMQLICETYQIMKKLLGMTPDEMSPVFEDWNNREMNSYLVEITRDILKYKDTDEAPLVDKILDTAGQKGTGKWASVSSLDEGIPLTLISEAVYARCLSALKEERVIASKAYDKEENSFLGDRGAFIADLGKALYAAKIISYAQGFSLLRAAAETFEWKLDYGNIALLWRGGCIIRSVFLGKIKEAFDADPGLTNLLLDPYFKQTVKALIPSWRTVVAAAIQHGIPCPALSSALCYFDGYTSDVLPANLLQAQRDYFGAHTYERVDAPRGQFFHTNWTGTGGDTSSTTYSV